MRESNPGENYAQSTADAVLRKVFILRGHAATLVIRFSSG
jgi:hypothetical protein